jgi:DNA ligase (NAD+)
VVKTFFFPIFIKIYHFMSHEQIRQQIELLREELNRHNYKYYVLHKPEISDFDFDKMLKELNDLEEQYPEFDDPNSPTKRVGSDLTGEFTQVQHKYQMLSLANTYSDEEIKDFDARVVKGIGESPEYVCELKYDGTAIGLTYKQGRLFQAITRGDGVVGDDVTSNVRTIKTIPLVLHGDDFPDEFEIRGEIFMPRKVFNDINNQREEEGEAPFANPRNAAAGTLKLLDPTTVAQRKLDCYLYFILGENLPFTNHFENLNKAKEWGFKIPDNNKLCRSVDEVIAFIKQWDNDRKKLPYDTDGVVIKVNSHQHQKVLGFTAKTPRWAIAFKYKAEQVNTQLLSVDFQVGRTGAITPVANLQPVKLAGSTVKRASLHNADQIDLLDVRIGDIVQVEKGGEIIPKIVGVDKTQRTLFSTPLSFIKTCPECGTPLVKPEGEVKHFCLNQVGCPPQIKGRIVHFISRKAMNIDGLGEETVELLFAKGLIRDIADLYSLKREQLLNLERFAEKSADNAIKSIEESRRVPFPRVLYGIGIRYVGETTARKLALHFGSIEQIETATTEQLLEVEEVGDRIAQSIVEYFSNPISIDIIKRLKQAGLQLEVDESLNQKISEKLNGLSLVISGSFSRISRDELKELIQKHGGKSVSSVSSSTSMLVAGDKIGPAKLEKAQKLGVRIVSEEEFFELISK